MPAAKTDDGTPTHAEQRINRILLGIVSILLTICGFMTMQYVAGMATTTKELSQNVSGLRLELSRLSTELSIVSPRDILAEVRKLPTKDEVLAMIKQSSTEEREQVTKWKAEIDSRLRWLEEWAKAHKDSK